MLGSLLLRELSSCSTRASPCSGFSCCKAWALGRWGFSSFGMRLPGSGAQTQSLWCMGLSCSVACGIFPDQGWNPCLLHWQVDYLPLSHQGSQRVMFYLVGIFFKTSRPRDSISSNSERTTLRRQGEEPRGRARLHIEIWQQRAGSPCQKIIVD